VKGAIDELESELGQRSEALRARQSEAEVQLIELRILRTRVEECESEIGELRSELAGARVRADQELRSLTMVGRELEQLRGTARGQATRIRLRALREAAELSERLRFANGEAGEAGRARFLSALEGALDRVAKESVTEFGPPPLAQEIAIGDSNGHLGPADRRRVSVDVGPFADFSQLVRFEDAANAIGATGDISIKRFSEGRARIDMALSEPIDLLRELESRCDLEFEVRSTAEDEIVLDVS